MNSLSFRCPHCNQSLEAPAEMRGETISCPSCNGSIQLPPPLPKPHQTRRKIIVKSKATQYNRQPRSSHPSNLNPHVVYNAKSRGIYIILALFLGGGLGIHNFYAGRFGQGAAQLIIMLTLGWIGVGLFINALWVLIEIFTVTTDGNGHPMS